MPYPIPIRRPAHETFTVSRAIYKITAGVDGAKEVYEVLQEPLANQGGAAPVIDNL